MYPIFMYPINMKLFGLSFILTSANGFQTSTPLEALYSPNKITVRTRNFLNTSLGFQSPFPNKVQVTPSSLRKNNYHHQPITSSTLKSPTKSTSPSSPSTSTSLNGKLWKRLQIEEDDPSDGTSWYLINCVAGVELDLLAQCRMVTSHFPPTDVEKFVVPVQRTLRSHGDKKKVVDVKVRYPGYVFCKIRLTEDVYETLQELELARSWMGTVNRKGHKKLPPAPIPLNYEEVKKFKGLEEETEEFENVYGGDYSGRTDTGEDLLEQYAGYDVGQMVKILKGNFQGEDGTVRRLKDGQLCVRMFTYGQTFDEWFMPDAVRPLTDLEVMRGLSGPTGPVTQDEFDVSIGKKDPRELEKVTNEKSLRSGLMQSAGIAPGRNRREDRLARGETGSRDRWGRTAQEIQQEEANWLAYREEQRASQRGVAQEPGLSPAEQEALDRLQKKEEQKKKNRMGDTWGMVERSSWTGGDFGFGDDALEAEEEFKHRTAELYKDRVPRGRRGRESREFEQNPRGYERDSSRDSFGDNRRDSYDRERRPVRQSRDMNNDFRGRDRSGTPRSEDDWSSLSSKRQDDSNDKDDADDFFASLMSELTEDLDDGGSKSVASRTQGSRRHDNAGPSAKVKEEKKSGGEEDDFFDNLMSELGGALESSSKNDNDKESHAMEDDDFFSNLEAELSTALDNDFGDDDIDDDDFSDDDFFSSLQKEIGDSLDKPTKSAEIENMRDDDFFSSLIDHATDEIEASGLNAKEVKKVVAKGKETSPSENLSSLTVPQLKEMLKSRGLKVGGKKAELIERLRANA